ncbi:MAG TPA: diphthine--ammonia ligase [Chitinophagaceae bacterium]|nr:diphthine--ammonia ligase [Chitinophagaceae bacterium]
MQKNSICSWSGGKDSCFALMKSLLTGHSPKVLLNVLNEEGKISRSHGIPANILQAQAQRSGLPIQLISSSWKDYEEKFTAALSVLKIEFSLTHAIFGDIDLQAHRDWEEMVCQKAGLIAVLPLWKQDRRSLVYQMLESGIETIIVSCNEKMGERFLGQIITPALVDELEAMGIDPCGENGEYHTLVLDCPLFDERINVRIINNLSFDNYWFSELELITG